MATAIARTAAQQAAGGPRTAALRSMTGFAASAVECSGLMLNISIRSVNHRHLDLRVHLPEALLPLEPKLRGMIQSKGARGHVDLKVVVEAGQAVIASVDEKMLASYIDVFQRIVHSTGAYKNVSPTLDVSSLAQLPGVVRAGAASVLELSPELEAAVISATARAVESWDEMRALEAAALAADLQQRIEKLLQIVAQIERWSGESLPKAQARLTERLMALVGHTPIEPARLAQEAILLADKADISEEILRMKSHLGQFAAVLADGTDAGRKLDFLLQEMNRESNTILSKVAGLGESSLPATQAGLDMKAEIEKIREQVQNLQ